MHPRIFRPGPFRARRLSGTPSAREPAMSELSDAVLVGLLEAAPDSIIGVDPDGRIALVNARTVELFGYTHAEMIGAPIEMLVPDGSRAAHPAYRQGYLTDP